MPADTVDGNDVIAIAAAAGELVGRVRGGQGPGFLEAITYRHRGHVGPKEDVDVGVRRTLAELTAWKQRDPIRRLADGMVALNVIEEPELERRTQAIRDKVAARVERAKAAPYPETSALLSRVYAGAPDE